MIDREPGCVFCSGSELTYWRGQHLEALFDIAPVVSGHTLIYSTKHYPSAADVPYEVAEELDEVCARFRSLFLETYGGFALFEHGRTGHCVRRNPEERICHHLHVHVLPLRHDLTHQVKLGQREPWTKWSQVGELAAELEGYLVVESGASGKYFYPVTHTLPSHFLRTVAAEVAGDPSLADWEVVADSPRSVAAIEEGRAKLLALIGGAAQ